MLRRWADGHTFGAYERLAQALIEATEDFETPRKEFELDEIEGTFGE